MTQFVRSNYIRFIAFLGVFVLVFFTYYANLQMRRLSNAYVMVQHTYQVITVANQIPLYINKLNAQLYGYLLTKNKEYLDNFDKNIQQVYTDIGQLDDLTKDNETQQMRISYYKLSLFNYLNKLQQIIESPTDKSLPTFILSFSQEKDKHILENLTQINNTIVNDEIKLLNFRIKSAKQHYDQANLIISISNAICIGLIILLGLLLLKRQLFLQQRFEHKLRESEDRLFQLAYYDTLTGLPNRTLLFKKVDEMISQKKPYPHSLAFLLIDIDNFKNVNDSSGYEHGDELILQFSKRLKGIFGKNNLISHLSGDNFVIVLNSTDYISDILEAAQAIVDSTKQPLVINHHPWFISVSIGISIFPNNGIDAKTLMKNADIAIHRAKEIGKNNYQFCTPEMTIEVEERALLDANLHKALANKEFVLLYQPKINLKNNTVTGVETLMRWNRPHHGLVNPMNFISLAESNGLIVPMGEWMIRTACLQGVKWCQAGLRMNVSINISTRQLIISNFVESVKKILAETQFDPKLLEFEITESILLEHSSINLAALKALKEMGIQITIDDFGTGYSSLNYLKVLDVDKLKIDKTFIDAITEKETEGQIIIAIIVMAHSLGIQVIAEGIEETFQEEFLKKHQCDEGQGFLYSTPLAVEEVLEFVRNYHYLEPDLNN